MSDFREKQLPIWEALLKRIFENNIPERYEWSNTSDIIKILSLIGADEASNHTFFPDSGGLDLSGAKFSNENGRIEVNFDSSAHVLKPKKLIFQSFPGEDSEWAYFRLETEEIEPSGVYENLAFGYEELVEITPGDYIERSFWDAGEYYGKPLEDDARLVIRILKGDFVIFSKASIYNKNPRTYDGRHNRLGDEGFKKHIREVIDHLNNVK